jgi:hypothetical protein
VGGSVTLFGGLAVAAKLYTGDTVFLQLASDASSSSQGGSLTVSGGVSISKKLYTGDTIFSTTASDASSTSQAGGLVGMAVSLLLLLLH